MSDFSFDASKSKGLSPFERLKAKTTNGAPAEGSPKGPQPRIFNEVTVASEAGEARLSVLEASILDLGSSKVTLAKIATSNADIADVNLSASEVSVKNVERAAELAESIAQRLGSDRGLFEAAQVANIDPPTAAALTKGDDGSPV